MNGKSNLTALFIRMVKHAAYIAALCATGYFIVMVLLHLTNMELTNIPDWAFRIAIIVALIWSVLGFRIRQGNRISFGRGFVVMLITTFFLAIFITVVHFIYYDFVSPDYHQRFSDYYVPNSKLDMYNNLMRKRLDSLETKTYAFTHKDSVIVENRMEELMSRPRVKWLFTTQGKVFIYFISTLIWGIVIAIPIAFMSQKQKKT